MAKITDPDSLSIIVNGSSTTEEVEVQTGTKTIELTLNGVLNDTAPGKTSGVTARAFYSFLKEEWLANSTLRRFKFPLKMIFEGSFIWVNGWAPFNDQTRDLIRDAGFQEQVSTNIYACLVSLGAFDVPGSDLAYYTAVTGFTATTTNFDKTGELNENVDITGATNYRKSYLRIQGKTYGEYNLLVEQGLSVITFQAYSFPLSNTTDLKVTESDANIDTIVPYTGMVANYLLGHTFETWATGAKTAAHVVQDSGGRWWFTAAGGTSAGNDSDLGGVSDSGVTWEAYDGEELIGSTYYAFNRVITCNAGTDVESYEWMQRQLRKTTDINADTTPSVNQRGFGTVNGEVAALLAAYVGDNLKAKPGVLLRGFDTNSTNNIQHSPIDVDTGGLDADSVPISSTEVSFPFVSAGNFNFSANLVAQPDVDTVYTVYFEYITRTSSANIALTGASGSTGTIDWSAEATILDHLQSGDYIEISGFATGANNGLYITTGAPTTNTIAVTIQNGATLVDEALGASVQVDENPYESPGAVIVNDNAGPTAMDAQITAASIAWDFDYTNNNQGGRTAGTDAPIVIVAQALDGAEWIDVNFTITAATGQNIAVNAGDERNYNNP